MCNEKFRLLHNCCVEQPARIPKIAVHASPNPPHNQSKTTIICTLSPIRTGGSRQPSSRKHPVPRQEDRSPNSKFVVQDLCRSPTMDRRTALGAPGPRCGEKTGKGTTAGDFFPSIMRSHAQPLRKENRTGRGILHGCCTKPAQVRETGARPPIRPASTRPTAQPGWLSRHLARACPPRPIPSPSFV